MSSEDGEVPGVQSWLPIVDGFTVVGRIGSGGYSTVFEAIQEDIGAPVALKVLEGAFDARGRSRFERECQSMGRLRDERGIVSVYSATYTSDQHPVIVMAYLPGGSLADRVKAGGPMSVDDVLAVAREICAALTAAHESGIYHRDIKPENILLDRFGRAALTDFGIATLAGEVTSTETASSLTPAHAPPERYLTEADAGDPVHGDIYSLASTLYALVAGAPPHGTVREGGIAALIDRILEEPPIPLTRTDVPQAVVAALRRGLSKNPSDRFDTASQLLAAREQLLEMPLCRLGICACVVDVAAAVGMEADVIRGGRWLAVEQTQRNGDAAKIRIRHYRTPLPCAQQQPVQMPARRPLAVVVVDQRLLHVGIHFIQTRSFDVAQHDTMKALVGGQIAQRSKRIVRILRQHHRLVTGQQLGQSFCIDGEFDPRCAEQDQGDLFRRVDALALDRPQL